MNQTFKQKAIVAAVSAAVVIGAVGFSTQAMANSFAATTQVVTLTDGQNVGKVSMADLGSQAFVIKGNVGGALADGTLIVSADNSAKFVGADVTADAGITVAANGTRTVQITGPANAAGTTASAASTLQVGGVTFTLTTDASKSFTITSSATGSTTLATVASGSITVNALAAALNTSVQAVFGSGASTVATDTVTLVTTYAFPLNASVAANAANSTVAASLGGGATGLAVTTVDAQTTASRPYISSGKLYANVASDTVGTAAQIRVKNIALDTSASTVGSGVNLSIDATSTTGVTASVPSLVANVKTSGIAVTKTANIAGSASTNKTEVVPGGSVTIYDIKIAENVPGVLGVYTQGGSAAKEVKLTLPTGWRFNSNSATLVTGGSLAVDNPDETSALTMSLDVSGLSASTAGTITLGGTTALTVKAPADAPLGDVKATVRVYTANDTYTDTDVVIATVVSNGTVASVVKSTALTTDLADAALPVLYSGRKYNTAKNVNDPLAATTTAYTTYLLKLQERGVATLANGATVTETLSNAKFETGYAFDPAASNTLDMGAAVLSNGNTVATFTTSAISAGTAGAPTFNLFDGTGAKGLDLTASTAGDLNVTIGGTAGTTAQTLKAATIKNATTASVSGALVTPAQNVAGVSLPDVVITEAAAKLLADESGTRGGSIILALDSGFTWSADVATAAKASATDSAAVVTIARTSDTLVTVTIPSTLSTTVAQAITIKGLKLATGSTAAGDINVNVQGAYDSTGAAASTAQPTAAKLKVGNVVAATAPSYPVATVADQTKLTLTNLPLVAAGNDQGRQGAVYVALIFQGNVFFQGADGSWTAYTGGSNVPAYFTGTLGTTSLNIVPTALDVSGAKGALFVTGYGLGIAGLGNPFDDFIKNARYNVVYTVK